MDRITPAVVAVGYNRPDTLKRLLNSVGEAAYPSRNVTLIISLDKSDNEAAVAAVAEAFCWTHGEKIVRRFPERQGLRSHILQCGDLSETYGAVIILEDDLIVSPAFYQYVIDALAFYRDEPCLAGIALYSHGWNGYANYQFIPQRNEFDAYLGQFSVTWGQCWSAGQWKNFRAWYAENEGGLARLRDAMPADVSRWPETSWGKYFAGYITDRDKYYLVPYVSLSTNCEEAGQHAAGGSDAHQTPLLGSARFDWRFPGADQAVRYDLFFERVLPVDAIIAGIPGRDICVDLNGTKTNAFGKRYVLSSRRYPLPVVASFGLRLRPVEANVLSGMPGKELALYDAKDGLPAPEKQSERRRLQYELYRFDWRRLLPYALTELLQKLSGRVRRAFRR